MSMASIISGEDHLCGGKADGNREDAERGYAKTNEYSMREKMLRGSSLLFYHTSHLITKRVREPLILTNNNHASVLEARACSALASVVRGTLALGLPQVRLTAQTF